jgi:hypothetical protein
MAAGHRHREAAVESQPAGWDDKKVYRRGRTTLDMNPFWCRETEGAEAHARPEARSWPLQ